MIPRIALVAIVASMPLVVCTSGCTFNVDLPDQGSMASSSSGDDGNGAGAGGAGTGGAGVGGAGTGGASTGTGSNVGNPGEGTASRCTASASEVSCPYEQQSLPAQAGVPRDVIWQVPLGTPPAKGWPVVLLFQGSLFGPKLMFSGRPSDPFGRYYVALTVKELLDAGYAVLAPAAHVDGATFWDTNVPPWSISWTYAPDNAFMQSIFESISSGLFGPLDTSRMYATGISSGGYMTSRMAVSYPGKFKALAIHSASYATCSGPVCVVPTSLPSDHPPTLFLHGEADLIVPISTMKAYNARLVSKNKETRVVIDPGAGHEWLPAGPQEVVAWFNAH